MWTILVLIPKGNIDTRGIGLLDRLWKVVEDVIDTRLWASIQFHNVLHGLHTERFTEKATMYLKISQYLISVNQDPLFLVFLYLRKAMTI